CLAAQPWTWACDPLSFRRWARNGQVLGYAALGVLGAGGVFGLYLGQGHDVERLRSVGRWYGAILHVQLIVDFLILVPQLLLLVWPKGGAGTPAPLPQCIRPPRVSLVTFRECIRQPMFWLIVILAKLLIFGSMVIPYFTFGEDYKMMKQLGFDAVMLAAGLFGLLAASISINEEIEGRTAITVMSK